MTTKVRKVKEVKQAIPAKVYEIHKNEGLVIEVTDLEDKKFIKRLAKRHLIAKRREDELKKLKKEFLNNIVSKYVDEADKQKIADMFDENKYIEFVADSDAVRNNIQYEYEYDNDELLKIANKRRVLEKVAKVSITDIRPFLEKGEEERVVLGKELRNKITISKK